MLLVGWKSPLPIRLKDECREENAHENDLKKNFAGRPSIDVGEVFYPFFDAIISNLTELLPGLGKNFEDIKHTTTIVELYYKLMSFNFRSKVQSQESLRGSETKSPDSSKESKSCIKVPIKDFS